MKPEDIAKQIETQIANAPTNEATRFTFRQWVGQFLFPYRHTEMPSAYPDEEPWGSIVPGKVGLMTPIRDGIIVQVVCRISFLDKVRIFLTGRLEVRVCTATENLIGKCTSTSACFVPTPKILDR